MMSYLFVVIFDLLFAMTKIKKNLNATMISLIKYELVKLLIIKYIVVLFWSPLPTPCHYRVVSLS